MKLRFFNIVLACGLAFPCAARAAADLTPLYFNGVYECNFGGILIGKMGIEAEETPKHYSITTDIVSAGLLGMFVKHSSHSTVDATGKDYAYPTAAYETHYKTRNKPHNITLTYKDGQIAEETQIPKDPPGKHPPIPPEIKKDAVDPLTFILKVRQALSDARKSNKNTFTIKIYDGTHIYEVDGVLSGDRTIDYGSKSIRAIMVKARRKPLAGFSKSELADIDPHEPTLIAYFSDDGRLMPVMLQTSFMLTSITATLVKECRTGESCLLGLKD